MVFLIDYCALPRAFARIIIFLSRFFSSHSSFCHWRDAHPTTSMSLGQRCRDYFLERKENEDFSSRLMREKSCCFGVAFNHFVCNYFLRLRFCKCTIEENRLNESDKIKFVAVPISFMSDRCSRMAWQLKMCATLQMHEAAEEWEGQRKIKVTVERNRSFFFIFVISHFSGIWRARLLYFFRSVLTVVSCEQLQIYYIGKNAMIGIARLSLPTNRVWSEQTEKTEKSNKKKNGLTIKTQHTRVHNEHARNAVEFISRFVLGIVRQINKRTESEQTSSWMCAIDRKAQAQNAFCVKRNEFQRCNDEES